MSSLSYLIRGLRVASDLPLGAFPRVSGDPDVVVRMGPASALAVRPSRPGCFEVRPGQAFFGAVGGGVVLVQRGTEILVDSRPGLDREALIRVVLDDGIEAVLHQRADGPLRRATLPARLAAGRSSFSVEEVLPY